MKVKPEEQEDPDINVQALIDMVFLMLVYFMATATLIRSEADLGIHKLEVLKATGDDLDWFYLSPPAEFGAFIDLGGADGLVHISELAWFPVTHPNEVLKIGQQVDVKVLRIDKQRERVGLSLKRVQPDPWADIEGLYKVNDLVEAVVTRVTDFGAFVRLRSGVEGLLHVSEMADIRPDHPESLVNPGDLLLLRVLRIEPERRRIGLSLRQVSETEWAEWAASYREQHAARAAEAAAAEAEAAPAEVVEVEAEAETAAAEVVEAAVEVDEAPAEAVDAAVEVEAAPTEVVEAAVEVDEAPAEAVEAAPAEVEEVLAPQAEVELGVKEVLPEAAEVEAPVVTAEIVAPVAEEGAEA